MGIDQHSDAAQDFGGGLGVEEAAVAQAQGDLVVGRLPGSDHCLVRDEPGGADAGAQGALLGAARWARSPWSPGRARQFLRAGANDL